MLIFRCQINNEIHVRHFSVHDIASPPMLDLFFLYFSAKCGVGSINYI